MNLRDIVILFGDNLLLESLWDDIQWSLKGITLSRRFVKNLSSSSRLLPQAPTVRCLILWNGLLQITLELLDEL